MIWRLMTLCVLNKTIQTKIKVIKSAVMTTPNSTKGKYGIWMKKYGCLIVNEYESAQKKRERKDSLFLVNVREFPWNLKKTCYNIPHGNFGVIKYVPADIAGRVICTSNTAGHFYCTDDGRTDRSVGHTYI